MNKKILLCLLFLFVFFKTKAQHNACTFVLQGKISTADTAGIPAGVVSVSIPEIQAGTYTGEHGIYKIEGICRGKYKVIINYLGYMPIDTLINFTKNVTLNIRLKRNEHELSQVVITGQKIEKDDITTATKSDLEGIALQNTRGLSLGETLKSIAGVNSLQTGPSISKPVIDGVYGNRILILNNDVRQEGQNWGNDHAPEIDPFIGDKISVIKGAASIRYGSDAIGGVVFVEPKALRTLPGVDGSVNLVGMTNGRAGTGSAMLEGTMGKKLKGLSWRLQGTLKKAGNEQTANYYVGNTGYYENDYSATLKYANTHFGVETYFSNFNTKIGIAFPSHIGTLADLYMAFAAPQPAVKYGFADSIVRGYQTVNHKLFKVKGFIQLNKLGRIEGIYAFQVDERKEYDFDVSYNTELAAENPPDLYFKLLTQTADLVWLHPDIGKKITGSMGLNFITHGNIQQGTGYQELIPNFLDYGGGAFIIEKWSLRRLTLEGGARYDYRWMRAFTVNPTTLVITRPTYEWQNSTFTAGGLYSFTNNLSANVNFGTAWRPPQVIELFADGIHQSAASFEHGDTALTLEKAYTSTASMKYSGKRFVIEASVYANYYHHYIYLKPDATPVETIQGTFPSFTYTQVNAFFKGADVSAKLNFLHYFSFATKISIVRAIDADTKQWLINIPADRFDNTLKFQLGKWGKLKDFYLSANNLIVPRQTRVEPNSDYVPPPAGYMLWGAGIGCSVPVGKQLIDVSLSSTNLTNVAYRDYMDRFRYFIDDPGRNIILRVRVPINFTKDEKN